MKPPQEASDLENVPMRRSTSSSTPSSSQAPRAARAEHADAVGLVDHQPRAVARGTAARSRGTSADVALHREHAVDHHQHAAAVALAARSSIVSSLSSRSWRKGRTRARDIETASRIEAWSPESQITVSPGPSRVAMQPMLAR